MMLLTKLKLTAVFVATVGVMGVLAASFFAPMRAAEDKPAEPKPAPAPAEKKTLATKITRREDDIGDVASALHIVKRVCEVEFQPVKGFATFRVMAEVYKEGKKHHTYESDFFALENPIGAKFALFATDLDYLPLANAPKNHYRMQIKMSFPSKGGSLLGDHTIDVPKSMFDFSGSGCGGFPCEAGSATEVPLFWLLSARSNRVIFMPMVSGVIEKNPKGDLLIVYLRMWKK